MIGENAVFERTEEGRLSPHEEQHGQHEIRAAPQETGHRQSHDRNLGQLDQPYQAGFLELVGQLAGRRREQKERQDERAGRDGYQDLPVEAGGSGEPVQNQDDQGVL